MKVASTLLGKPLVRPGALRIDPASNSMMRIVRGGPIAQYYPVEAKARHIEGLATVDLLVNEDGQVVEAQLLAESPQHMGFGLAALDLVKTFEMTNTLETSVLMTLTVKFTLND